MSPSHNFEEMYLVLYGASATNKYHGAKYDVIKRWFEECKIIDNVAVTERFFEITYSRVRVNKEDLTQSQFVIFLCLLAREARKDIDEFFTKFHCIKDMIIEEIRRNPRCDSNKKSEYNT
ncbi:unnamed protein product [Arctia plantaginis]|uniref:Uncharacterized protein n=1 Tax=Arctia plantaginis TaxID=874455 RepID=A0A8S0ZV51_ARCPL|nr:unnamed protein product [Arctia plantaginis]